MLMEAKSSLQEDHDARVAEMVDAQLKRRDAEDAASARAIEELRTVEALEAEARAESEAADQRFAEEVERLERAEDEKWAAYLKQQVRLPTSDLLRRWRDWNVQRTKSGLR